MILKKKRPPSQYVCDKKPQSEEACPSQIHTKQLINTVQTVTAQWLAVIPYQNQSVITFDNINYALGFTQPLTEMSTRNIIIIIIMFLGSKVRRMCRADTLPSSVSRLSRQCEILNISQPYRPPRPVTGIALLYGDGVCFL
jgi:hypothetical protein